LASSLLAASGLATGAPGLAAPAVPAASPRREWLLDDGWRFHLGHASDPARDFGFGRWNHTFAKPGRDVADAAARDFDDSAWEAVRVPHDWAAALPFAHPDSVERGGRCGRGPWFPRHRPRLSAKQRGLVSPPLAADPADRARAVWLEFDGVFRAATVIVNGYVAHESASGYAPFKVDIADFLNSDDKPNWLVVRVDASLGEGWFYEGAGIYRHVRLISAAAQHVPHWGVRARHAAWRRRGGPGGERPRQSGVARRRWPCAIR
jgi:beta-galactosidase